MKRISAFLIVLLIVFSAVSCDSRDLDYKESYNAVGMLRSNTENSCKLSFASLDGTIVYKLKYTAAAEGQISYKSTIKEGEINVYYDIFGSKEHLFRSQAGYPIEGVSGYIESDKTVYIIIEALNAKGGSVEISLGT